MSNLHTSTCSPASEDLLLPLDGLDSKPLDSAKSTHTAKEFSKNIGRKPRSTQTSKNCGGGHTEIALFSQEDSLASPFLMPGSEEARMMTVTSGRKCSALLKKQSPLGLLAKMLLESSTWNSTKCALIWKQKATKSNRLLFQLVPSMPHTEEIGFGLYATPNSRDWKDTTAKSSINALQNGHQKTLGRMVHLWPTPQASDNRDRGNLQNKSIQKRQKKGKQLMLSMVVSHTTSHQKMWPTPSATESRDCGNKWETLARLWKGDRIQRFMAFHGLKETRQTTKACLNPFWVEWLMGYPIGHTALKDWATPSSRRSHTKSSKA